METIGDVQQISIDQMYQQAANMLMGGQNSFEVKEALMARGLDAQTADDVIENIELQINSAKKSKAQKDMLYGALWCIGGVALTMADVGFIFWGAIVFGAIQFIRGATNLK